MAPHGSGDLEPRKPQASAFAQLSTPKLDYIGPTVDDDIRRAISRYGAEAVKEALKEATKAKRGRKQEADWIKLQEFIEADARDWLAGNDPFAARTNYSVAKAFAERHPGYSMVATHQRIARKLAKEPFDRRWHMLVKAEILSRGSYPFAAHLRTLEALSQLPEATEPYVWQPWLDRARSTLTHYAVRKQQAPPDDMTFREIEDAVAIHGLAAGFTPSQRRSLFGSLLSDAVTQSKE